MRRLPLVTATVLVAAAVTVPQAFAHATLVATTPLRGATLATAPQEIRFDFSEPVEIAFSSVHVYDSSGTGVDDGTVVHPDGRSASVVVGLRDDVADGTYTATFRVISADGHPVSGGFVFAIGAAGRAPQKTVAELTAGASTSTTTSLSFKTARAVQYGAIALAIGVCVFLFTAWFGGLRQVAGSGREWEEASLRFNRSAGRLLGVAVTAGILSGIAGIVLQGATAAGTGIASALHVEVVSDVLETRFGTIWGLRLLVWAAFGVVVWASFARHRLPELRPATLSSDGLVLGRRLPSPAELVVGSLLLGFLAISPALAGHARAEEPAALLVPANVLHVVAIAVWAGGLAAILFALPSATRCLERPDRSRLLAAVVSRFSMMAGVAVAVVLLTGVVQSIVLIGDLDDLGATLDALVSTAFGRAILVKVALVVLLLGLGALNRYVSVPRLQRVAAGGEPPGSAGRLLRRAVTVEVALLVVVLGATGALASFAPAAAAPAGPFSGTQVVGPAQVQLTIDPAQVGRNLMHVYLIDPVAGQQFDDVEELTVTLVLPDRDIGPLETVERKAGPGHFVMDGATFGLPGDWEVRLAVRVSEFDAYYGKFDVPVR